MTKRIRNTGATYRRIVDTSATLPRIDPKIVAEALGAEPTGIKVKVSIGPITRFAVQQELFRRLRSSGGRPGLSDVSMRAKIPVSEQQWTKLEELAAGMGESGFTPSAGQVASVLLSLAIESANSKSDKKRRRRRSA